MNSKWGGIKTALCINYFPRLLQITGYWISWITCIALFFLSHFLFISPISFFLFPPNDKHSADRYVKPEHRQVKTQPGKRRAQHFSSPSIPRFHIHKMSTLGKAFLPCHPPIHLPMHPILSSGLVSRIQARSRWPSDYKSAFTLPFPPFVPLSSSETFKDLSNAYVVCPSFTLNEIEIFLPKPIFQLL